MHPIHRRIAGAAALLACAMICVAAQIEPLTSHSFLLWHLLGTACVLAAVGIAATRHANQTSIKVRQLQHELSIAQAEREHAQAIIHGVSDAIGAANASHELLPVRSCEAGETEGDSSAAYQLPVDQVARDPSIAAMIQQMRQGDHTPEARVVEHKVATAAGPRTFQVTLSPIADQSVAPAGVVAVCQDVTAEKEVSEIKNDFVSMVSHELRTPLASIKAYIEMLIDGEAEDDKTEREFYDVIQNEANRLGRLIDNILNISRIESGLAHTDMQPQHLDAILEDAIEVIKPQAKEKKITVTTSLMPAPYKTRADRDMLYQAVLNLLSNAIKYTQDGGAITVETSVDPSHRMVLTKIIDNGVGIPPKDLPYVFDKFYRAEANNRIAPGTGLGLALVRHIIETVHGGRVFVESHVGAGSCFGFELNLSE